MITIQLLKLEWRGSCVRVRVPYARIGVGCCYGQGLRKKNSGHAVRVRQLTSVFGGTSIKGLRSAAIPGLPSPPLAAILELPHPLGDLQ
jgi:hypothetical protein